MTTAGKATFSGSPVVLAGLFVFMLPWSISGTEIAVGLGAAWVLWTLWRRGPTALEPERLRPIRWPLLLLTGSALASSLLSPAPLRPAAMLSPLWTLLAFLVPALLIRDAAAARRTVSVLLAVGTLVALYGIVQHFTGIDLARADALTRELAPGTGRYRVMGFFSHPLTFAYSFAFILFFAVARALHPETSLERRIALGMAVVVEAAIWMSGARGAWLATSALLLCGLLLPGPRASTPSGDASRRRYALLPALLLPLALLMASSPFQERAAQLLERNDQRPRLLFWRAAVTQLERSPLLGVGTGHFRAAVTPDLRVWSPDVSPPAHAHQLYLQLWVESGLPALIGFLWLVWRWGGLVFAGYRHGGHRERALLLGAAGGVGALLLGGLSQDTFGDAEVQRMLAFAGAVLLAAAAPGASRLEAISAGAQRV